MGRQKSKSAMRLLEQSVHLLRRAPADLLPFYYIGSLPFVLGMLYFWSDMSRNADARGHAAVAAMGMALLFVWMKSWQAVFSTRILARLGSREPAPWSLSRLGFLIASQTLIQASGVVVLPLALLMTIPAGWCFAFYQNVTALNEAQATGVKGLCREAIHQAKLWPRQNHKLLAIFFVFSLVVGVNLAMVVYGLPYCVKTIIGYESIFTLNAFSALNTTFMATVLGLTYLCVDPLVKTVYALRCFDGFSMISGDDIRMELKDIMTAKQALAVLTMVMLTAGTAPGFCGEKPDAARAGQDSIRSVINPQTLNQSIEEVLMRREFSWRLPRSRPVAKPEKPTWLPAILEDFWKMLVKGFGTAKDWLKRLIEWIEGLFDKDRPVPEKPPDRTGWMNSVRGLIVLLALLLAGIGGALLWKIRQRRLRPPVFAAPVETVLDKPDLDDENVRADALPSDRWIAIAKNLWREGNLRQALRAFFLATLAQLSEQGLVTIQRYKSNRDYVRELQRRAYAKEGFAEIFALQADQFDRVWYGMHQVTETEIDAYAMMQAKIGSLR